MRWGFDKVSEVCQLWRLQALHTTFTSPNGFVRYCRGLQTYALVPDMLLSDSSVLISIAQTVYMMR